MQTQCLHNLERISMTNIRLANVNDIEAMVLLSDQKRCEYAKLQPQFWRRAENANEVQIKWFKELLERKDYFLLVAEGDSIIVGFVIGRVVAAPQVYNPGGMTMMIDDFCVKGPSNWSIIGKDLIDVLRNISEDVSQLLVVCGVHDEEKRQFLREIGLSVASEWYVGAK